MTGIVGSRPRLQYPWVVYADGWIFGSYKTRVEAERVAGSLLDEGRAVTIAREGS